MTADALSHRPLEVQTPCVADRCRAVLDRRFLLEEGFERARAEVVELLERTAAQTSAGRADGQRDRRSAVLTPAAESAYRLAQNLHIVASR